MANGVHALRRKESQDESGRVYQEVMNQFLQEMETPQDRDISIILLKTLKNFVKTSSESTMQGFLVMLKNNIYQMFRDIHDHKSLENRSTLTFKSITDIYLHLITKHIRGLSNMEEIKQAMVGVGDRLMENFETAKYRIYNFSRQIIKDGDVS